MEIAKIYKSKISPLTLKNTLKDAILKVLKVGRKVPIVEKENLVGALTDSDLLGMIVTRKYGPNHKISQIDYISFPVTINKEDSIKKAIELMKNYNLGSLIVVNEKNYPEHVLKDYELIDFVKVDGVAKDFITKNPICAKEDSNENLLKMLVFSKFRNLPVIDKNKNFVGMLSVRRALKMIYLNNFQTPTESLIEKVKTFEEDEDISKIKKFIKENEAAIITKENKVVGIITAYDILKRILD